MTIRDLVEAIGAQPMLLAVALAIAPTAAWLLPHLHGRGRAGSRPWRQLYSVLVYLACVPGMLAAVLTAYTLFFTRDSLLDVNLVYVLPLVSMVLTLVLIGRTIRFERIPAFDRLAGLMITLAVSFAVALAISKTRIWLVFHAPMATLLLVALVVFVLLRWGTRLMTGRRGSARRG